MRTNVNIHLGPETSVTAPEWADAFLDIADGGHELSLFLGYDDADRLSNVDKLQDALHAIRIRVVERLRVADSADPMTQAKAADE